MSWSSPESSQSPNEEVFFSSFWRFSSPRAILIVAVVCRLRLCETLMCLSPFSFTQFSPETVDNLHATFLPAEIKVLQLFRRVRSIHFSPRKGDNCLIECDTTRYLVLLFSLRVIDTRCIVSRNNIQDAVSRWMNDNFTSPTDSFVYVSCHEQQRSFTQAWLQLMSRTMDEKNQQKLMRIHWEWVVCVEPCMLNSLCP